MIGVDGAGDDLIRLTEVVKQDAGLGWDGDGDDLMSIILLFYFILFINSKQKRCTESQSWHC